MSHKQGSRIYADNISRRTSILVHWTWSAPLQLTYSEQQNTKWVRRLVKSATISSFFTVEVYATSHKSYEGTVRIVRYYIGRRNSKGLYHVSSGFSRVVGPHDGKFPFRGCVHENILLFVARRVHISMYNILNYITNIYIYGTSYEPHKIHKNENT